MINYNWTTGKTKKYGDQIRFYTNFHLQDGLRSVFQSLRGRDDAIGRANIMDTYTPVWPANLSIAAHVQQFTAQIRSHIVCLSTIGYQVITLLFCHCIRCGLYYYTIGTWCGIIDDYDLWVFGSGSCTVLCFFIFQFYTSICNACTIDKYINKISVLIIIIIIFIIIDIIIIH